MQVFLYAFSPLRYILGPNYVNFEEVGKHNFHYQVLKLKCYPNLFFLNSVCLQNV